MQVSLNQTDTSTSAALREFTDTRIVRALRRFGSGVRAVTINLGLSRTYSRRPLKECQVQVRLADGDEIIVRSADHDAYGAVLDASRRVRHTVVRKLQKHRIVRRRSHRHRNPSA